jgi:hypothetical protein
MCLQAGNTYSRFIGNNAAGEKKKQKIDLHPQISESTCDL